MRVLLALGLLLTGTPLALASPLVAALDALEGPVLDGRVELDATRGALDLSAITSASELELVIRSAEGRRVVYPVTTTPAGSPTTAPRTESIHLGEGTIRGLVCGPECRVGIIARGEGNVGISSEWGGAIRRLDERFRYCGEPTCAAGSEGFNHEIPLGAWVAEGSGGRPSGAGTLVLFLRDAALSFEGPEGRRDLDARTTTRAVDPVGVIRQGDAPFIVLTLREALLTARVGDGAVMRAEAGSLRIDGGLAFERATGTVAYEGRSERVQDQALGVRGRVTLALEAATRAGALAAPVDSAAGAGVVEGEATEVTIDGVEITPATAGIGRPTAAVVMGLGGLALVALLLARGFLVGLYSRLSPADLFENPNRVRVYTTIQRRPGTTPSDIARDVQLARVVVQHHLAVLEAHRTIAKRADGRSKRYYPTGAVPTKESVAFQSILLDETRRRIAVVIAARTAGATQRDVVEATRASQRLVSYHVAKLEAAGLVRAEGSPPRRYHATDPLRGALGRGAVVLAAGAHGPGPSEGLTRSER